VEGRDITAGTTDVVVCDGFTGNVVVKTIEGTAATVMGLLKASITSSAHKLGALLLRGAFTALKRKTSYDEHGGAPLLGVNGIVIICHGKSNGKAIANALRAARSLVDAGALSQIARSLEEMKRSLEPSASQAAP
jgi:glycerol-3-phosphate acyltransferase PlsX